MPFHVQLTRDTARDPEDIYDYIERRASSARAQHLLGEIEKVFQSLSTHPHWESLPTKLLDVGIREYREVSFAPYRIIYRVVDEIV